MKRIIQPYPLVSTFMKKEDELKDLLSKMNLIELKYKKGMKVICPICNVVVYYDEFKGGGLFQEIFPRKCEHISANVEIHDYELENLPINRYKVGTYKDYEISSEDHDKLSADEIMDKIYDAAAQQKYIFSAFGNFPIDRKIELYEPENLQMFLEDRQPDCYIKIKDKKSQVTRYYFFNQESFGFLEH
jgi:hypothetical protein